MINLELECSKIMWFFFMVLNLALFTGFASPSAWLRQATRPTRMLQNTRGNRASHFMEDTIFKFHSYLDFLNKYSPK